MRNPLKYLFVFLLPFFVGISFLSSGWWCYIPVLFAFGFVPLVEFLVKPDASNISDDDFQEFQSNRWYDLMLYLVIPVQYGFMIWFFMLMGEGGMNTSDLIGRVSGFGLMCGVLGINVAHELGHRIKKSEQNMAKALLLTSLFMHFFIEHNKGHHRNIGTPEDPVTARKGEALPVFWLRSITGVYRNAWRIANSESKKKNGTAISIKNEMVMFTLIEIIFILFIFFVFGWMSLLMFLVAAGIGYLLLETVEYIEHYGLKRNKISEFRYENTRPAHSWNSDHQMGRLLLFELSRHSDHHYQVHKKYQTLKHHDDSPQMPTGYPGMMLLALIPPLWFKVMNPRVERWQGN